LAERRRWPALTIRAPAPDPGGDLDDRLAALLDDFAVAAIEDLAGIPLPPGGLWDPAAPPPAEPPASPLHWRVFFSSPASRTAARDALGSSLPDLSLEEEDVADEDWAARSQRSLGRVEAGPFIVAPPWDRPAAVPEGSVEIVIEPSMGFGTGHHPTTRLCLRLLGAIDVAGRDVLDLGTGSGVLAIAAARRGAARIVGVDIDPDAVATAELGAARNAVAGVVTFRVADFRVTPPVSADVVLANLTAAMIVGEAARLAALVRPGGRLVLGGFSIDERAAVFEAMRELSLVGTADEEGWSALVFQRRPAAAALDSAHDSLEPAP
jgi:ribosomal protein L11 methyltransferase